MKQKSNTFTSNPVFSSSLTGSGSGCTGLFRMNVRLSLPGGEFETVIESA
jgi:hypothetical protein